MTAYSIRSARLVVAVLLLAAAGSPTLSAPPATTQPQGLRDNTPDAYALVGAKLVLRPGKVWEKGTIVVRDGVIAEVSKNSGVHSDARRIDATGKTIYAGFVDAYSEVSISAKAGGAPYWNDLITPQQRVAADYKSDSALNNKYRRQGVTARLAAPASGVIKGVSAVVTTGDEDNARSIVSDDAAQHVRLTVPRGRGRDNYPNSPMGAVALARQAMLDAAWFRASKQARKIDARLPTIEQNDSLQALQHYTGSERLVVFDAINELYLLRADRFAREFSLRAAFRGSGNEYRRLDAVRRAGRHVITPVNFPKPPNVSTSEAAMGVSTEQLMHWDHAPENPGRLARAGVAISLTAHGLEDVNKFLDNVRTSVARGLDKTNALRALTTNPAKLLGVDDKLGEIAPGKLANLVVASGDIFEAKSKITEVWVAGKRFNFDEAVKLDGRGKWSAVLRIGDRKVTRKIELAGEAKRLEGRFMAEGDDVEEIKFLKVNLLDSRLSAVFEGKAFGREGIAQLTAVITREAENLIWTGQIVWPDGKRSPLSGRRESTEVKKEEDPKKEKAEDDKKSSAKDKKPQPALFDVNYPLGAFGVTKPPAQPKQVMFTNVTVWTCAKKGILKNASVLIGGGRVLSVGKNLSTPDGAIVIDGRGKHLTPGIIDCHSHMATDGGVNESTQAVTAEVRIGDFIDSDDVNIYRQLAGGVTTSNILHGSANPIGGQNQVIKLRWGQTPERMKFAKAPAGIKFALGENVKQSNWGDEFKSRYPQTRMGVEQLMRDEFQAAREYAAAWDRWKKEHEGLPPRRDLELEAVVEILAGKRWIHCHSYRQDEILALIRTLDDFNVRIGSFQHILEGYKVAPEMARHGATGSAFSDWWAYKFEVFDAIPYNGALMHEAGVVVSFNSDDRELARHLNHEAAKAVKYGGVPAEEALKFVTLNPAKQLRIDRYVGSIEKGKHADVVLWSGSPLSILSRCEQTWVDGRKYFDRSKDLERREHDRARRAKLIQRILASGEAMLKPGEKNKTEEELWPRDDEFCHHHHPHEHDE